MSNRPTPRRSSLTGSNPVAPTEAEAPAPKGPAAKKPATPKAPKAARRAAARPRGAAGAGSTPREPKNAPESVEEASETPEVTPAPTRRPRAGRVAKFAATYRLPEDALDLVDLAQAKESARLGRRVSKDDVVAEALRKAYGRLAK